ncbi:MAG: hypothetical protein ACLFVN_05975 [Phycisphaeraceae bacterium]
MWDLLRAVSRGLNRATGSRVVQAALNARLAGETEVLNLHIDSHSKTIRAEVQIKGQSEPVSVEVLGYRLSESEGRTKLAWEEVRVAPGSVDLPPGLKDKLEFIL